MKKRMIVKITIIYALVICTTGCLGGKYTYKPPDSLPKINNFIEIEEPKDLVWQRLVAGLGREYFVINNLDKESGFINVSYGEDPELFIDCGEISSWVSNLRGRRDYVFPASRAAQQFEQKARVVSYYLQ
ncbi:hypothetical protein HYV49_04235 [Candidatus Pacearchaeota archaeon]|nr:hypothetical protein [Candidatus Pacearchaeota archaeon]